MAFNALKESSVFACQRYRPTSSPARLHASPRRNINQSRVLAALSAVDFTHPMKEDNAPSDVATTLPVLETQPLSHQSFQPLTGVAKGFSKITNLPTSVPKAPSTVKKGPRNRKQRSSPALLSVEPEKDVPAPAQYSYNNTYAGTTAPVCVYTRSSEEADDLVGALRGPLGFDMEWQVSWLKKARRTALVQLSDEKMILLIQLSAMNAIPPRLKGVIESPDIIKTGVNIRNDGQKLFHDFGLIPKNLVELSWLSRQADEHCIGKRDAKTLIGLAKLVEKYTGTALSKGPVRTSNWEAQLNEAQLEYAANDAHCALTLYRHLVSLAEKAKQTLRPELYTINFDIAELAKSFANEVEGATIKTDKLSPESFATSARSSALGPSRTTKPHNAPPSDYQILRAYKLWHERNLPLADICSKLRSKENPLKESTVISYVVEALKRDPKLPFDKDRLRNLAQLEVGSWTRHREWFLTLYLNDHLN